ETLHDYFAEELFQAVPEELKASLLHLSLAPHVTRELAEALVGDRPDLLLESALIHGFLTPQPGGGADFHPLLRQFLRDKLDPRADETAEAVNSLVGQLLKTAAWDDAFALLEGVGRWDFLPQLLDRALDD